MNLDIIILLPKFDFTHLHWAQILSFVCPAQERVSSATSIPLHVALRAIQQCLYTMLHLWELPPKTIQAKSTAEALFLLLPRNDT